MQKADAATPTANVCRDAAAKRQRTKSSHDGCVGGGNEFRTLTRAGTACKRTDNHDVLRLWCFDGQAAVPRQRCALPVRPVSFERLSERQLQPPSRRRLAPVRLINPQPEGDCCRRPAHNCCMDCDALTAPAPHSPANIPAHPPPPPSHEAAVTPMALPPAFCSDVSPPQAVP